MTSLGDIFTPCHHLTAISTACFVCFCCCSPTFGPGTKVVRVSSCRKVAAAVACREIFLFPQLKCLFFSSEFSFSPFTSIHFFRYLRVCVCVCVKFQARKIPLWGWRVCAVREDGEMCETRNNQLRISLFPSKKLEIYLSVIFRGKKKKKSFRCKW